MATPSGEEERYFASSATLRIHSKQLDFEEVSSTLGLVPTHLHRKGEKRGSSANIWRDDAWHYQPDLDESRPLEEHIMALWQAIKPHVAYLKSLKQKHKVDVFCGYRSNCNTAGFDVDHKCLELFMALEIPFGVSIIVC